MELGREQGPRAPVRGYGATQGLDKVEKPSGTERELFRVRARSLTWKGCHEAMTLVVKIPSEI